MASNKITDRQLNSKPGSTDIWLNENIIRGHGSLSARITPAGERLFYFRYTAESQKRVRLPIGSYSKEKRNGFLSLSDARVKASELAALHKSGITDIKEHLTALQTEADNKRRQLELERIAHEEEQAKLDSRKTVDQLFEHWASVDLIRRKDGGKEVRRIFLKDVIPIIGKIYVEDVKKGDITKVTDRLLARGINRMAKQTFSLMRQMFRFAVDRDLLEHDPTGNIRKIKIGGKDTERDRVLSSEEITMLSTQLPQAGLLPTTEAAVWIALSTCCRIGELLSAEWKHIDFDKKEWLIPPENSKNGKAHTIFLSDFSIAQFEKIHFETSNSKWCYPNRNNNGPVSSKTITKQLGDRQRTEDQTPMSNRSKNCRALYLPGGKWTPHDLRRTGATMMVAAGVLPEVAERCLNHMEENKVKRVYQRYSYHQEMNDAWKVLGNILMLESS